MRGKGGFRLRSFIDSSCVYCTSFIGVCYVLLFSCVCSFRKGAASIIHDNH
jgi:hypothetical protein